MSGPGREVEILVDLVRRAARVDADPRADAEARRLERAWRRRTDRRRVTAAAGALAIAGAVVVWLGGPAPDPLRYSVEGDVAWADRHVEVRGASGAHLSFSDGTRFSLDPGSGADLATVDDRGAQLRLSGRAHAAVVHRPGARWSVHAGPFTVKVVGTVFDVAWSQHGRRLEVALIEGEVKVEGPLPRLPLAVRAGERLVVSEGDRTVQLARTEPPPPAPGARGGVPLVSVPPPSVGGSAAATPVPPSVAGANVPRLARERARGPIVPRTSTVSPARFATASVSSPPIAAVTAASRSDHDGDRSSVLEPRDTPPTAGLDPSPAPAPPPAASPPVAPSWPWAARLARGEFSAVLDEALAEGLERCYRARSERDLADLADAARYLGRKDVAQGAWLVLRQRFPGEEAAGRAAFRLGVLAEERGAAGLDEALRWYATYNAETPSGTYAAEALGRQMLAVERRDGSAAARTLARLYLRRFPRGPYSLDAERLSASR